MSESEHPLVWNLRQIGGDCLYKIAHSWLDSVVNPVQTALGCPLRTEALAYPINGADALRSYWPRFVGAFL